MAVSLRHMVLQLADRLEAALGTHASPEDTAIISEARAIANRKHKRPGRRDLWTAEDDAALGTDTDAAVAAKIGRTANAVKTRRITLGIQIGPSTEAQRQWWIDRLNDLRQLSVDEFSSRHGRHPNTVRKWRRLIATDTPREAGRNG